jgi:hypothetical protein
MIKIGGTFIFLNWRNNSWVHKRSEHFRMRSIPCFYTPLRVPSLSTFIHSLSPFIQFSSYPLAPIIPFLITLSSISCNFLIFSILPPTPQPPILSYILSNLSCFRYLVMSLYQSFSLGFTAFIFSFPFTCSSQRSQPMRRPFGAHSAWASSGNCHNVAASSAEHMTRWK